MTKVDLADHQSQVAQYRQENENLRVELDREQHSHEDVISELEKRNEQIQVFIFLIASFCYIWFT